MSSEESEESGPLFTTVWERRPCERCGWVRRVKVTTSHYDRRVRWSKICEACHYVARSAELQRQAEDFRLRAVRIRAARREAEESKR